MVASQSGHAAAVTYLLGCGAELNKRDNLGRSALYMACKSGQSDCTEILLSHGAELLPDAYVEKKNSKKERRKETKKERKK